MEESHFVLSRHLRFSYVDYLIFEFFKGVFDNTLQLFFVEFYGGWFGGNKTK